MSGGQGEAGGQWEVGGIRERQGIRGVGVGKGHEGLVAIRVMLGAGNV